MAKVLIEKLDSQLKGIGYLNGKIIFVPKVIPGEEVDAVIQEEKKRYLEGTCHSVLKESEKRIEPKCPYFFLCGGCDLEHISYDESVLWKKNMLEELFQKNKLWNQPVEVLRASKPWNYRNKITLKVVEGRFGFYEGKSHDFVEIKSCAIAKDAINEVIADLSLLSIQNGEITLRVNHNSEIMMHITSEDKIQIDQEFILRHKITGIYLNGKLVFGEPYQYLRNGGILYQVSMDSFFQVNPEMSEKLFFFVRNVLKDAQNVLDLYSGVGTLGFQALKQGIPTTGIESVKSAVLNAISSAKLNQFKHYSYHLGKVEKILPKIPKNFDTVIVDPPRSGLVKKTKGILLEIKPEKIIYVSCNPITLIRDLKELNGEYGIDIVKGFDMFPYTRHVECVCVLNRL